MTMTPAELAALPTVPAVSSALDDAANYASSGAINALSRSVYGSDNPNDYAAFVSPEHTLAWATALIAAARIVDPAVCSEWPKPTWDADRFAIAVGEAHPLLTGWAEGRSPLELAELFRAAAQEVREAE